MKIVRILFNNNMIIRYLHNNKNLTPQSILPSQSQMEIFFVKIYDLFETLKIFERKKVSKS
jgi:hypothetical protein